MVTRAEIMNAACKMFPDPRYVEIGVSKGETFFAVNAAQKFAVDPLFRFSTQDTKQINVSFFETTSDEFFAARDKHERFDVIFLDGLHTFDQTLKDFINALNFLSEDGIIVIDDVMPTSYQASLASQEDMFLVKDYLKNDDWSWMGDTFKLIYFIYEFFPRVEYRTIESHGQTIAWVGAGARKYPSRFSADRVCQLDLVDVVKSIDIYHFAPFEEILSQLLSRPKAG